jgi:hypothetical protein
MIVFDRNRYAVGADYRGAEGQLAGRNRRACRRERNAHAAFVEFLPRHGG